MRDHPIIVQKYGGACLETPEKIRAVASSIAALHRRGRHVVVIVSAQAEAVSVIKAANVITALLICILLQNCTVQLTMTWLLLLYPASSQMVL